MMNLEWNEFLNIVFVVDVINIYYLYNLIYNISIIITNEIIKIYNYLDIMLISVTGIYFMAGRKGATKLLDTAVKIVTIGAGVSTIVSQTKGKSSKTGSKNSTTTSTTTTNTTTVRTETITKK